MLYSNAVIVTPPSLNLFYLQVVLASVLAYKVLFYHFNSKRMDCYK